MNWTNWAKIKKHPYIVGGGVFFLVVLIWFFTRSSSSSGGGVYAYAADPNITAANAQQTISQNQTNAAVAIDAADNTAAATINGQNTSAAIQLATLQANTTNTYNNDALQAVLSNNATSVTTATIQSSTLQHIYDAMFNSQTQLGMAQINGTITVNLQQLADALSLGTLQSNNNLLETQNTNNAQVQIATSADQTKQQANSWGTPGGWAQLFQSGFKL